MNEKRAKMLTRLFIFGFAALFALFIAGIVTLRTCGSCRGKWKASRWSGDRTLWCEPGDVMVLKDKTVKHKNAEVRVKRGCKMTLINVTIESNTPIMVDDGGTVVIRNCRLRGIQGALRLGDGATAVVKNTVLEGGKSAAGLFLHKGASVDVTGGRISGGHHAVEAFEEAQITLRKVTLQSPGTGIEIRAKTIAKVFGGSIRGERRGINLWSKAQVEVTNGRVDGGQLALRAAKGARAVFKNSTGSGGISIDKGSFVRGVVLSNFAFTHAVVCLGDAEITLRKIRYVPDYIVRRVLLKRGLKKAPGFRFADGVKLTKEQRRELRKDGPSAVLVAGKCRLVVEGCDITSKEPFKIGGEAVVKLSRCRVTGGSRGGDAVYVWGQAQVSVSGSHLLATQALRSNGRARVTVNGGSITGEAYAVNAKGRSRVNLDSTVQIYGKVHHTEHAVVNRLASGSAKPSQDQAFTAELKQRYLQYAKSACGSIAACYKRHRSYGAVSGTLTVWLDELGKPVRVEVTSQKASPKVTRCLKQVGLKRKIPEFAGPKGQLVCTFSGVLGPAGGDLEERGKFIPGAKLKPGLPAPEPPGPAPAAPRPPAPRPR